MKTTREMDDEMVLNLMEELNTHIEVFDNARLETNLTKTRDTKNKEA